MVTLYSLHEFIIDARQYLVNEEEIREIYEAVEQQEYLDDEILKYTVEVFNQEEETFLGQESSIVAESYHYTDDDILFAVKKDDVLKQCIIHSKPYNPQDYIESIACLAAKEKVKQLLLSSLQLNHDAYVSAIKEQTAEAAQEELVIELMNRGVL